MPEDNVSAALGLKFLEPRILSKCSPTKGYIIGKGLGLVFTRDSNVLYSVEVELTDMFNGERLYLGELPFGLTPTMVRDDILKLQIPVSSIPPGIIPGAGPYGGSDTFSLPTDPAAELIIGYDVNLTMQTLRIKLSGQIENWYEPQEN